MAGLRGLSPATPPEGQPGPGPCETLRNSQLPFPNLSNLNASDLSKISQISIIIIELDFSNSKAGEIKKSYIIIMYPKRNEKSSIKTIHRLF